MCVKNVSDTFNAHALQKWTTSSHQLRAAGRWGPTIPRSISSIIARRGCSRCGGGVGSRWSSWTGAL